MIRMVQQWSAACFMALLLIAGSAEPVVARPVTVAVISDGEQSGDYQRLQTVFVDELTSLTSGEFSLQFRPFGGGWSSAGINAALDQAYADPQVTLVLVLGIAANQMLVSRPSFAKPTFLPLVFDADLLGAPASDGQGSGRRNLNYLSESLQFEEHLRALRRVYPFQRVGFVVDQIILEAVGGMAERARQGAQASGVTLHFMVHGGTDSIWSQLPDDADAILVTGLPRMPSADFDQMLARFAQMKLPSFSLVGGQSSVARGFLASDAADQDWTRLARRNALNMQAVLLGELAEDQPVQFESKRQLTINMEVARQIGLSPRFDVLTEAVLLNEQAPAQGPLYSLSTVAQLAAQANLDVLAEGEVVGAGLSDVRDADAAWLPQLQLNASQTRRNVSPLVQAGQVAERSSDASLSLSQVIYADRVAANRGIQRQLQRGREEFLQQTRLDVVRAATTAFLNVLRAQTQLRVRQDNLNLSRTNLDLARDRVRVGSSSPADLYRWQTRMADARSQVLSARAGLSQARNELNRYLNRPLDEAFQLTEPQVDEPFSLGEAEFNALIDNPAKFELLTAYFVDRGLERAPELQRLGALRAAKARELIAQQRSLWLPDFSLRGQYSENLGQSGIGAGPQEYADDWNLMMVASIPLYSGGQRRSAIARARRELDELDLRIGATREKVEQGIRANLHAINASYPSIALSREAAVASSKNLELVTDAYAKGVVSILDLLDAQNAALQANEAADNAVYNFLIDVMAAQRASSGFDMLLSGEQQLAEVQRVREYINRASINEASQ